MRARKQYECCSAALDVAAVGGYRCEHSSRAARQCARQAVMGGPCSAEDAGYNACNIKRVPGWELPEQNAIDPRRRTEHATVGWCSLTSKVVTFALPIRLALLLQACRARPTLAPGRAESPSFCESYSRLKNIVLSSPPLHLFIILSPTTVEHGVSWI